MLPTPVTRRHFLSLAGSTTLAAALTPRLLFAREEKSATTHGVVVGDPISARIGERVLREGGNAVDAAVTAAFASCICSPSKCGIGGYGGHAMIALAGKKPIAIDFNSTAPAAARADMFPLTPDGRVVGNKNITGWLAAGVPGTVAGLELMLTRHGTRRLRETLAPAIELCEAGVHVAMVKGIDDASRNDPRPEAAQDAKLPREKQRNAALARLLKTLAADNSTESFYRGDIARAIAAAFQRNGGLVTREDLAAFRAHELAPLAIEWNGMTVHTVPLTATGLLVLQALAVLKEVDWSRLGPQQQLHAKADALRVAWADRARTFGDPEHVQVPVAQLLSQEHVGNLAARVAAAVKAGQPVAQQVDPSRAGGTIHLSVADRHGNLVAVTLTHGGGYGARVAVDELGLVLGHGMSRFDPRPGLPNSIGPRKRPLTNMCPTIVTHAGKPVLAVGAAGGTRIPNSVFEVLANFVGRKASLTDAMASPRLHTDGTLTLGLEKNHAPETEAFFKRIGYQVSRSASAYVSAVALDPQSGAAHGIASGGA